MCLGGIRLIDKSSNRVRKGYKFFKRDNSSPHKGIFGFLYGKFKRGIWHKATYDITFIFNVTNNLRDYTSYGFHIIRSELRQQYIGAIYFARLNTNYQLDMAINMD